MFFLPVYIVYAPSFIPKSSPIYDDISPAEFLVQPQITKERIDKAKEILKFMLGYKSEKEQNWLIFPQDYLEARPTGGFPGTYMHVTTKSGDIKNIRFDDIWSFDKQLEKQGKPQLNQYAWWSHFPSAAVYAIDVYKNETGHKIDGVMVIDPTGMKYILRAMGPVQVKDFNEVVDYNNITDKILSYSPYARFGKGAAKHKMFMASIVESMNNQLSGFETVSKRNEISEEFLNGLEQKHILVYSTDLSVQNILEENNWAGALSGGDKSDFLAVRDYNAGINKVDIYIDRDIEYKINIGLKDNPEATLKIKYKYEREPGLYRKYGNLASDKYIQYKNILKVYAPSGAKLIDYDGYDGYIDEEAEDSKTVFKGRLTLNPDTEKSIILRYKLPFKIEKEYRLIVSKQPGVPVFDNKPSALNIVIETDKPIEAYYPGYDVFKDGLVGFKSDMAYDRYIKLRF